MARHKGDMDKKPRVGYTMSPSAYNQRAVNAANIHGKSAIIDKVIDNSEDLSPENKILLKEERTRLWRKLSAPVLLLTDQYSEIKTLINLKRLEGKDVLGKDLMTASKLLLEISKEINRLTQVSADKKMDVYSKSFNTEKGGMEDIVIDLEEGDKE